MANKIEELTKDVTELEVFLSKATRQRVKDVITIAVAKLNTQISTLKEDSPAVPASKPVSKSTHYVKQIDNYGWDQSPKFMKVYVTVPGVQKTDASNVTTTFTDRSVNMTIGEIDGKGYKLGIARLHEVIVVAESYHKVKTDTVVLFLKKQESGKTWPYITEKARKDKPEPSPTPDKTKDPNESLMEMMKKMYDEGDDEMKRSISKAWTQSRDKTGGPAGAEMGGMGGDMGGMPGMGGMGMGGMPGMGGGF